MTAKQTKSTTPTSRSRAIGKYDDDRASSATAKKSAGEQIAEAPFVLVAGGIAFGAILAALLPTSRRERALLAPVTDSLKDKAAAAVSAAKDAGQARLDELGLTRDAGGETIRKIVDGATDALKASAKAAATKVRGE